MPAGKQTPGVVAIAHTNEKHRSPERVLDLVRQALDHLGGISRFVRPGQTVLIKPNQTVFYSAEEGCTTDPLVVSALIRLAKEGGAAEVAVGESSGGFFSSLECMKLTGMTAVAERERARGPGADRLCRRAAGAGCIRGLGRSRGGSVSAP